MFGVGFHEVTSSVAPSNSNLTSSWRPSTSTSLSGALSMLRVTSDLFNIACWLVTVCVGWTLEIERTGNPASSNAFFFNVVLIWELQNKNKLIHLLSRWRNQEPYTVRIFICSLILLRSSENFFTTDLSISISSSVHFLKF